MSDLKDNRKGWSTTSPKGGQYQLADGGQFKRLFQILRSKKNTPLFMPLKKIHETSTLHFLQAMPESCMFLQAVCFIYKPPVD